MKRQKRAKLSSLQIIALGFFIIILAGTCLLMLPCATRLPGGASFGEALFTATSATCVTGLVLRDTATYWSAFGQVVILLLIQTGGLGFMTIATLFLLLLRRRLGLRQREVVVDSVSYYQLGGLVPFIRRIFFGTLLAEGLGAALLSIRFVQDFGLGRGLYYGVWHAVSAFCNAGFDLMGAHSGEFSSFVAYGGDPLVSLTLMGLILVGGAGFLVWDDLARNKLRWRRYRLQTKIVLFANLVLVAGGGLLFLLLERNNLGAGKPLGRQMLEALFDAVTPRTAGFNTTDTAALSSGSLLLTMVLMFIGGSPGSTAGGVKTTTLSLLLLSVLSVFRRRENIQCFQRRIAPETLKNAVAIFTLYLLLFSTAAGLISMIDDVPLVSALFESASAIGTVGLSLGITGELSCASHMILAGLMYFGRVGGLTMIYAIISARPHPPVQLPLERITVG